MAAEGNIEVFPWLKSMPVAPEYHPTLAEFQDPIAYIFKIEKEASKYGICKIVPPVPSPPKKTALANFNKSLLARCNDPNSGPTFTTRQQQVGFCPRKHHPVQRPVWQSGENYTLSEFEAKAKNFEKNYLKKYAKKAVNALEMETLYWKASVDKPFTVEYANDMPGSAFVVKKGKANESVGNVGDTEWNMRGVSRAKCSLLRFMKEEIPGVTSPMVYVAMMFSWFAWHVEDHDLHSLNYLHMGAGKTWYGVPRDAAVAFEEVIRVHGYGGEINPLVTFATLGEKTTVMSPEVLLNAGVPCCRLVQNPGEFVVTFPRAYHSGFSQGFNCGEAANIATPEWLRVAKDAAIRRASINCPPMVSHFQLLYDLALSLCSRVPKGIQTEPRSSRLKDKRKGRGEMLVKELFVKDVVENNKMLHILGKGSSVLLLPKSSLVTSSCSNVRTGSQTMAKSGLFSSYCSPDLELKTRKNIVADSDSLDGLQGMKTNGVCHTAGKLFSLSHRDQLLSPHGHMDTERKRAYQGDRLSDQGLFSCVTCGILCFACVAIVQPTEATAHYLMSADCSTLKDLGVTSNSDNDGTWNAAPVLNFRSGSTLERLPNRLFDIPMCSTGNVLAHDVETQEAASDSKEHINSSALGLLALAYGNSSDSEDRDDDIPIRDHEADVRSSAESGNDCDGAESVDHREESSQEHVSSQDDSGIEVPLQISSSYEKQGLERFKNKDDNYRSLDSSIEFETNNCKLVQSNSLMHRFRDQRKLQHGASNSFVNKTGEIPAVASTPFENTPTSDEDSSRMHVFCLQHAELVVQRLSAIGGVQVFLVCHPDYPNLEAEAKKVAEELEHDHLWTDTSFREASGEDEEILRLALESENAIHGNGDWAVKLGINLYYSANLSRSPIYSKQMPYNAIIYNAFGRGTPADSTSEDDFGGRGSGRQRRLVVAGKWCGKTWMSSQVHPLLINKDYRDQGLEEFSPFSVKPDLNFERPSRVIPTAKTAPRTPRIAGKRKRSAVENRLVTKGKSPKVENPDESSEDTPISNSKKSSKTKPGNKRLKKETPEPRNVRDRSKKQIDTHSEDESEGGPSSRLRKRTQKSSKDSGQKAGKAKPAAKKQQTNTKAKKGPAMKLPSNVNPAKPKEEEGDYSCDIEGCTMSFGSKQELLLHKRNICPVKGCGKKFFSHKYLVQHRRVHMDDRPLKCPWKGCKMTFKWAWARTEHIRVHTGERPYSCTEAGCGQTFRFVSDFSRHKRKTGHCSKKARG